MNSLFYVKVGELQGWTHREDDRVSPNGSHYTAHVVRFEYENGWAEYDGGNWKGVIYQQ